MASNMKRRANGEGSVIYKRKDGRYTSSILNGKKADGSPNRISFYGKTEAEVRKKIKEYREKYVNGGIDTAINSTVEEYITKWLKLYKKNELKQSSYSRLQQVASSYIFPEIGFLDISSISSDDIQELINNLKEKGYSYSTYKKVYDLLNACYKHAIVKKDLSYNPCLAVRLPAKSAQKDNVKFYSKEDAAKIVAEATRKYGNGTNVYRLGWAIVLLLYTGMRVGEMLALTWEDIYTKKNGNKYILINKNMVEVNNKVVDQDTPKTKSGNREIPLSKKAREAVDNIRKITGEQKYIMTTKTGGRVLHSRIHRTFKCICKAAKIEELPVHSLRHTFASMLFEKGIDVQYVSALLGHSDTSTTRNIYIHLIEDKKEEIVAKLDDYLD